MKLVKHLLFTLGSVALIFALTDCSRSNPGPDKTLGGAVLGAGWGAGAGAIVGHHVEETPTGEGALVGAGLGLVGGAVSGYHYDAIEDQQIKQEKELASLKVQNMANSHQLEDLQAKLDRAAAGSLGGGVYQVFFDPDQTSLRAGAIANLEAIGEMFKGSPSAYRIKVVGHTDDSGNVDYNERLAEARARNVSQYLGARGVGMDQIIVESFGGKRPIAANNTPEGRQLNRRVDIFIAR